MPVRCCGRAQGSGGHGKAPGYIGDSHLGESRLRVGRGDQGRGPGEAAVGAIRMGRVGWPWTGGDSVVNGGHSQLEQH